MFWVLVMGFGVRLQRTLASLKRDYEMSSETELSDGSWYEWFTPGLTDFFKVSVSHAIEHLAQERNRALNEKLSQFQDVIIQDSSIVRLHESLSKKWPAVWIRRVAVSVKVSLLIAAVADGPKRVAIHAESKNELKHLVLDHGSRIGSCW